MPRYLFVFVVAILGGFSLQLCSADDELKVISTYGYELGYESMNQILVNFSKQGGGKIKVELQEQDELKANIIALMEKNALPDAVIIPADHVGLHQFVKYSEVDPSLFNADVPKRIWGSGFSDGKLYGAPLVQGSHLVLFYNKALVKEPAPDWDTMLAHKAKFDAQGRETISWSFDEPFWFLPFLGAYGGWPINDGKIELDTPAMAAALVFYKSLHDKKVPYPTCNYQCTVDAFKSGGVAYTINGEWEGKNFSKALGDNLGVSAIPMAEGNKILPSFSTYVVAFPNNSLSGAKRSALIKFVDYMQSFEVQRQLWEQLGAIPVESYAFDYAEQNAKGYLKETIALMDDTKPLPADQAMSFIWDALGKGALNHKEGAMDAKAAATYMQRLAERHMRNAKRRLELELELEETRP